MVMEKKQATKPKTKKTSHKYGSTLHMTGVHDKVRHHLLQNMKLRNRQIQSPKLIGYTVQSAETERSMRSEDEVKSHTLMLFVCL